MSFWLGYDLDNTTLDYEGGLREFCGRKFNIPEEKWMEFFPLSNTYDLSSAGWHGMDTRAKFLEIHAEAVESGLFARLKMYKDAAEVMWRLRSKGHKSSIITARYLRTGDHHVVNETTSLSLDIHKLPVDELHVTGDKVRVLADIYFEDSPHNIEVLRAAGRTVVVADQLYNRHFDGLRAHNWLEFEQIVDALAEERASSAVSTGALSG